MTTKTPKLEPVEGPPEGGDPQGAEDIFARAAAARKERQASGSSPKIVRKPMKIPAVTKIKAWFRTHETAIFPGLPIYVEPSSEDMEKKPYYVIPDVEDELEGDEGLVRHTGYLICTAAGKVLLLLVRDPDLDGSMHSATESKHDAAREAIGEWTRMSWDKDAMQYEISTAEWERKTVRWPDDVSEANVMRQAFGKQIIDSWDHEILKRARGED